MGASEEREKRTLPGLDECLARLAYESRLGQRREGERHRGRAQRRAPTPALALSMAHRAMVPDPTDRPSLKSEAVRRILPAAPSGGRVDFWRAWGVAERSRVLHVKCTHWLSDAAALDSPFAQLIMWGSPTRSEYQARGRPGSSGPIDDHAALVAMLGQTKGPGPSEWTRESSGLLCSSRPREQRKVGCQRQHNILYWRW